MEKTLATFEDAMTEIRAATPAIFRIYEGELRALQDRVTGAARTDLPKADVEAVHKLFGL